MNRSAFNRHELATTLFDIGAIQFGKYKLYNGRTARLYLDFRLLVSYPEALRKVAVGYHSILEKLTFDVLAAPPLAGLPIGTAVSLEMNKPLIYPRKIAKSYGTGRSIEGVWEVGQTAVLLDDVMQTGESILQAIVSLKAGGIQVHDAVILIDREYSESHSMLGEEYKIHSLFKLSQLLEILEENGRISSKQHSKVLKSLSSE